MKRYFLSIRAFVLLIVAAAVLSLAVGCGDDDDSEASGGGDIVVETGSLSKAEFVKEVDELCEATKGEALQEYGKVAKVNSDKPNIVQPPTIVENALVPPYEGLIESIRDLGAPSGDESEVTAFVVALQEDLDFAKAQPKEALSDFSPFDQALKEAKAYGLTGCVKSMS